MQNEQNIKIDQEGKKIYNHLFWMKIWIKK